MCQLLNLATVTELDREKEIKHAGYEDGMLIDRNLWDKVVCTFSADLGLATGINACVCFCM